MYGVICLMFWSITLIVSVKYVVFVLRADNDGEGGVMALAALVRRAARGSPAAAPARCWRSARSAPPSSTATR